MNGVNPELPSPLVADYPDGGAPVDDYAPEDVGFTLTAHPDGLFRVWRADPHIGAWNYYPVRVVGMTPEEIRRSVDLACRLLSLPHNRAARRAIKAVH